MDNLCQKRGVRLIHFLHANTAKDPFLDAAAGFIHEHSQAEIIRITDLYHAKEKLTGKHFGHVGEKQARKLADILADRLFPPLHRLRHFGQSAMALCCGFSPRQSI